MRATRRHILDHPRVLLSAVLCLSVPAGAQEGGQSFGQTFVAWAKDQFQDAARSQAVTQVLGSSFGGSVNQAVDLYGGLKDIVTHGLTAIQQGMNGDLQAPERFFNQELPNDMLNLVLPGSLKDVVPNAQKLYDQMQQAGSDLVNTLNQAPTGASGATPNTQQYFSDGSGDGLQPGSAEAQAARSENIGSLDNVAATTASITASTPEQVAGQLPGDSEDSDDEDYEPPPAVVTRGPNSERDTDFSSVTVAPLSMTSSDPNSCIKTSGSLGVGSVSIECNSVDDVDAEVASVENSVSAKYANALSDAAANNDLAPIAGQLSAATQEAENQAQSVRPTPNALQSLGQGIGGGYGAGTKLPSGASPGCSAFHQAAANLAQSYVPIAGSNSCQAHRTALRLDQLTLQTVMRYSGACAEAAAAVSSTEATIRTETQMVSQACSQ